MQRTIQDTFRSGTDDPAELWSRLARGTYGFDRVDTGSEAMGGLCDDDRARSRPAGRLDETNDAGGVAGAMGGLCDDR